MKKKIALIVYLFQLLLLLAVTTTSCTKETVPDEPLAAGTIGVHFTLKLPGATSPGSTRTTTRTTTPYENTISDIHILIFNHAAAGTGTFIGLAPHSALSDKGDNTVTCQAELPINATVDIVVLANLPATLNPEDADLSTIGTTKANFIAWFEDRCETTPWDMTRAIPLWGEVTKTLTRDHNNSELPISLVRSLARIDVKLKSGIDDFIIETIRLYNPSQNGQIIPDPSNWDAGEEKVTAPSVSKGGYNPYTDAAGYLYTLDTPGTAYEGQIYTPEAPAGSAPLSVGWTKNTCLIIGGYFGKDNVATPQNLSYYRVDFTDASGTYLPLLRNHKYVVTIDKVYHHGQDSPEAALAAHPVNAMFSTVDWTTIDIDSNPDINSSDEEFYLTTDRRVMYVPKAAYSSGTNSDYGIKVTTNHPDGWTASGTGWWVGLSDTSGGTGITNIYLYTYGNGNWCDNEGIITIKAGDVTMPVKVVQRNFDGVRIVDESGNELPTDESGYYHWRFTDAPGNTPYPLTFTVLWSGTKDLTITNNNTAINYETHAIIKEPFQWNPGTMTTAYRTHGVCEQTYSCNPPELPSNWATLYPDGGTKRETIYSFGSTGTKLRLEHIQ